MGGVVTLMVVAGVSRTAPELMELGMEELGTTARTPDA
jgi:hypothetical protein